MSRALWCPGFSLHASQNLFPSTDKCQCLPSTMWHSVNTDLYKVLVKELAHTLDTQLTSNSEVRAAGLVINTMGWVEGVGYEVVSLTW